MISQGRGVAVQDIYGNPSSGPRQELLELSTTVKMHKIKIFFANIIMLT